ncbi:MAG TPA: translation elongation factor Ts [Candidatus Limnocylindria bacterium]|nr:translation elongation factor Ts [Candidatus Limnocylindria bacterium]
MQITADQVKQLRDRTGAGMMECKKALSVSGGDVEKAVDALRKSGAVKAEGRSGRDAREGAVEAYIHPGNRVGVLIEVNCETDFVARTPEFQELVRNLALQVAAAGAEYVRREEIPAERIGRERDVYLGQLEGQGKPPAILEKIVAGKLEKFYAELCLMEQPYIRDDQKTVGDLVKESAAKTGENVVVRRFSRFRLGQE